MATVIIVRNVDHVIEGVKQVDAERNDHWNVHCSFSVQSIIDVGAC